MLARRLTGQFFGKNVEPSLKTGIYPFQIRMVSLLALVGLASELQFSNAGVFEIELCLHIVKCGTGRFDTSVKV